MPLGFLGKALLSTTHTHNTRQLDLIRSHLWFPTVSSATFYICTVEIQGCLAEIQIGFMQTWIDPTSAHSPVANTHNNGSNPALFSLTGSWMFSRTYNNQNGSTHRKHTSGVLWVQTASRISSCLIHHIADLEVRLKKVTTVLCHLSGSVVLFTLMSCGFPTV